MTVAEIKEYIDKTTIKIGNQNIGKRETLRILTNIKSMLDKLEQEKNMYNELEDKIVRGESIPLMANEKFIEMLEKDTELEENK